MDTLEQQIIHVNTEGELLKQLLEQGELEWEDGQIQFFIPLILHFTNFDWLQLIAEHNLVEEDTIIVKNFLDMVQSLMEINQEQLQQEVDSKIERILRLMEDM